MGTVPVNPAEAAGALALERRHDNLAFVFQEILTAIERLRSNRQVVTDAEAFRAQMRQALASADQEARARGYTADQSKFGVFAVVAFLDEAVLNLQQPVFALWPKRPLQEELFGVHVAGEHFFQNVQHLLAMRDGHDVADVLEVYELCLLLGYKGRYGLGGQAELRNIIEAVREKMRRIRGSTPALSPHWQPPPEAIRVTHSDPWVKRLMWSAVGALALSAVLFGIYSYSLSSGASDITALATEARR